MKEARPINHGIWNGNDERRKRTFFSTLLQKKHVAIFGFRSFEIPLRRIFKTLFKRKKENLPVEDFFPSNNETQLFPLPFNSREQMMN